MCQVTLTTPLSWDDLISALADLGLATINLQTKFEVSNYIHYEDMRTGAKCTNWDSLGRLGVTQGHQKCHLSIERVRLPIRL